ncbi:hypothetical protein B0T26DRAFT_747224 [Lasiosphaeria miniovina]|uniref:Uncharacterized protein n=1 Tax=Lasiosphaeria miniovina TaxID=1954250 RepID=A0AA40E7G3_9PEZI|nr:uncharacterized protein B0T26DRAFT_747224 [Lasiosphaeria miniovina]KAK0726831.1 hypothetical protein B0T26DRAFT_747224 [Lasiosphaeria miniovina]
MAYLPVPSPAGVGGAEGESDKTVAGDEEEATPATSVTAGLAAALDRGAARYWAAQEQATLAKLEGQMAAAEVQIAAWKLQPDAGNARQGAQRRWACELRDHKRATLKALRELRQQQQTSTSATQDAWLEEQLQAVQLQERTVNIQRNYGANELRAVVHGPYHKHCERLCALKREYRATQRRFGALLGRPGTSRTGSEAGAAGSPALSQAATATSSSRDNTDSEDGDGTSGSGGSGAFSRQTAHINWLLAMNRPARTSWWAETDKMPVALRDLWRERLKASEDGKSATAGDDSADEETALDTNDKEKSAEAGDEETDVEADDKL